MKTNAIIRIVLFSIAILILLGILGALLGVHLYMFRASDSNKIEASHSPEKIHSDHHGNSSTTKITSAYTAEPGKVREIEISWVSGGITVSASADVDTITVSESEPSKESQRMVCSQQGDTLKIHFSQDSSRVNIFGITNSIQKDLTVLVPVDWKCNSLEIKSASTEILVQNMTISELDIESASGNCTVENSDIGSFDVEAASGDIEFCGTLNSLNFEGASSNCTMILNNCPKSIEMSGMSGNLTLTLPQDCGFTAELQGLSTDFSSEFETSTHKNTHVHGNGSCRIHLESMSGSVKILKGSDTCHENHR